MIANPGFLRMTPQEYLVWESKQPMRYAYSNGEDDRDRSGRQFIRYPCLIAEVLSPSTEAIDRERSSDTIAGLKRCVSTC